MAEYIIKKTEHSIEKAERIVKEAECIVEKAENNVERMKRINKFAGNAANKVTGIVLKKLCTILTASGCSSYGKGQVRSGEGEEIFGITGIDATRLGADLFRYSFNNFK